MKTKRILYKGQEYLVKVVTVVDTCSCCGKEKDHENQTVYALPDGTLVEPRECMGFVENNNEETRSSL